jgi:hypothetical protein
MQRGKSAEPDVLMGTLAALATRLKELNHNATG